jgi:hypothetical protein
MSERPSKTNNPEIPVAAAWLGSAGILPFLGFAILALFAQKPEQRELGLRAFANYSAIILSFLGGVRWGATLALPAASRLLMSVAPSVLAFACLLLDPWVALQILGVLMLVVAMGDLSRGANALWPAWYQRLRLRLSVAVIALHILVFVYAKI